MHFHFVFDEPQYNDLLSPLMAEALARRHTVTTGLRGALRYDADAVIGLQDVALRGCPRPRVFLTHGLGLAKRGHLTLDADLLVLPYAADAGVVDDQAARPGQVMRVARGVGSPKIDLLARRRREAPALRARLREIYGFDARPIVGYCPTWRHDGTLHHKQRAHRLRAAEAALEPHFNVVVLPHSLEHDPEEVAELRFRPSDAMSRLDHLVALDAVVTDTSGIGFELCAIDMPLVLLDNPAEPDYLMALMLERPVPIDYGPACPLDRLAATVAAELAAPHRHAARRAHWADLAFGPRDGQAAARAIDAITDFAIDWRRRAGPARGGAETLQDYRHGELALLRGAAPWAIAGDGAVARPLLAAGGSVSFGPYQRLGAGRFALELDLEAPPEAGLAVQVDAPGFAPLASLPVAGRLRASLPFAVPPEQAGADFEFRLHHPPAAGGTLLLRGFRLLLRGPPEPAAAALPGQTPPKPPAAPAAPPAPPEPEPLPDPIWNAVTDALRPRFAPADRLLAPEAFRPWFPAMVGYSLEGPPAEDDATLDWVVLHKGWLDALPPALLRRLARDGQPVMANAVFVLWRLPEATPDLRRTPHVGAFLQHLRNRWPEREQAADRGELVASGGGEGQGKEFP